MSGCFAPTSSPPTPQPPPLAVLCTLCNAPPTLRPYRLQTQGRSPTPGPDRQAVCTTPACAGRTGVSPAKILGKPK
eukprot:9482038-Pyramimonas_sp.AAC.1